MVVKIKNWDIPESCYDCPLNLVNQFGERKCWFTDCNVSDLFLIRHDECPMEESED